MGVDECGRAMDTSDPEADLLRRCRAGDKDAFGRLVRQYAGRAVGAACALLGNRDDALEASQDAFIRAWRGIGKFDGRSRFYTWYATVLRNVCISRLRRKRHPTVELTAEPPGPAEACDPSVLAERNERTERLWAALRNLPLIHREVLVMNHFQHMTYKDIAAALDVPIGTVMSRLHNARKALRALLEKTPASRPRACAGEAP